jgi:hypothetical protein
VSKKARNIMSFFGAQPVIKVKDKIDFKW